MNKKHENVKILSILSTKELYLVTQEKDFQINEYFIMEDSSQSVPLEIIEVYALPLCIPSMMPVTVPEEYIDFIGLEKNKQVYIAKAKPLIHLDRVVLTNTVREAKFSELEDILINAKEVNKSLVLGNIQGTANMFDELPDKFKGIAPEFKDGKIIEQSCVPFLVDPSKQREYPHSGYFGGSGSGKSFALKVTCEELMKNKIPGIVIDPHGEMEFKENSSNYGIDYKSRNDVYFIGKDIGINFTELNCAELVQLCEFINPLTDPQKTTLESLYETGMTSSALIDTIDTIRDIVAKLEESKREYDEFMQELSESRPEMVILFNRVKKSISNVKAIEALQWKVKALIDSGIFDSRTAGVSSVETTMLQGKLAIIRGDLRRLQMISTYLINKLYKKRRRYQDNQNKKKNKDINTWNREEEFFPMFFIVLDEAHNFAPNTSDERMSPTKRVLKTIAQEARKYGVFEIMCTQRIGLLDSTIVAQMNNKFIFRTTNAEDLKTIKMECGLSEQELASLPDLSSGHCIATSPTFFKNFNVKFRTTFTKSSHPNNCFEELEKYNNEKNNTEKDEQKVLDYLQSKVEELEKIKTRNPGVISGDEGANILKGVVNITGNDAITFEYILNMLDKLATVGKISKKDSPLGATFMKKSEMDLN